MRLIRTLFLFFLAALLFLLSLANSEKVTLHFLPENLTALFEIKPLKILCLIKIKLQIPTRKMRTAFSVVALMGLTLAQYQQYPSNPWANKPQTDTQPEEPEEEEDTRPEECKTKIEGLETDLTAVESTCDAQSSQLAMLQAMIAAQTTIVNPVSETISNNVALVAGCT